MFKVQSELQSKNSGAETEKRFDKRGRNFRLRVTLVGVVAQLVEHHNGIVGVAGSNPVGSTIEQFVRKHRSCFARQVLFQPMNQRVF